MSVPVSGGYYRPGPQIDFGWISQAWAMFQAQAGTWIGAMALFLLVALVIDVPLAFVTGYSQQFINLLGTFQGHPPPPPENPFSSIGGSLLFSTGIGIVQSILMGGLYRMALRQGRGEAIQATEVFSALDMALPLIAVTVITQFLMTIGIYLCILPYFVIGGLFMFAPVLVVDRRLGPIQAITESVNLLKSQWLLAALFYFVVSLIGGLGAFICLVGLAVTYPILINSVALGYLTFTQPVQPLAYPEYGAQQPGVWPPPPGSPPPGTPPFGGPPMGR